MELITRSIITLYIYLLYDVSSLPTNPDCAGGCYKPKIEKDSAGYFQRVDLIKNDILEKLGLKEVPKLKRKMSDIPAPVLNNFWKEFEETQRLNGENGEDKVRTHLVLSERVSKDRCPKDNCIKFAFKRDNIDNMNLWVYRNVVEKDKESVMTVLKYDSENPDANQIVLKSRIHGDTNGWVALTIKNPKQWIHNEHFLNVRLTLAVQCSNCHIQLDRGKQPFLDITEKVRVYHRSRRNLNCNKDSKTCCLDNLYLNFTAINWQWIFAPLGYNAQQCRGSCDALHVETNEHGGIVRTLAAEKKENIKLCCTAHKYSALDILYQNTEGNIEKRKIPNMIATECGCG